MALFFAAAAFLLAAAAAAAQVVGIVSLVSRLLGLPPSLVGLTLLAVGASMGDFFSNSSMAKVRGRAGERHVCASSCG